MPDLTPAKPVTEREYRFDYYGRAEGCYSPQRIQGTAKARKFGYGRVLLAGHGWFFRVDLADQAQGLDFHHGVNGRVAYEVEGQG